MGVSGLVNLAQSVSATVPLGKHPVYRNNQPAVFSVIEQHLPCSMSGRGDRDVSKDFLKEEQRRKLRRAGVGSQGEEKVHPWPEQLSVDSPGPWPNTS